MADVTAWLGLAKVTGDGPVSMVHWLIRFAPEGKPLSVTDPRSVTLLGSVTVWFGPALTTGACCCGACTVTVTWELVVN